MQTIRQIMGNEIENVAVFDDTIYRGDQMNGLLDRMELLGEHPEEDEFENSEFNAQLFADSKRTKINIVVPFISSKWLTKELKYGAHLLGDLENNGQLQKHSRISATRDWGKQLFIYTQNAVPTFLDKIKSIGDQGNELLNILMLNWSEGGYTMIDVHEHALTLWFEHRVPDRDSSPFAQFAEKKQGNMPPKYLFFKKGRQLWYTRT